MAEVSVCIPTYNGARYLRDCLDSVVNQSFRDLEIVVVDDNSSDDTVEIAAEYAGFDDRIRLYRNPANRGLVGNWNEAIARGTGQWIKFVFQDDMLTLDCIAEMHALAQDTGAGFVGCFRHFLFEEGVSDSQQEWYLVHQAFVASLFECPVADPVRVRNLCLDHFAQNFVGEPTATLLHRDLFGRYGHFDPAIAHRSDAEFWCRVGSNVGIAMVPRWLATFRVHAEATTHKNLSNRSFANEMLDPLIMLSRFLNDPEYAALRAVATERGVLGKMQRSLAQLGKEAHRIAHETPASSDSPLWKEWSRVVSFHPRLQTYGHIEG